MHAPSLLAFNDLKQIFAQREKYRLKQALDFVFKKLGNDWNDSNLPTDLKTELGEKFPLAVKKQAIGDKNGKTVKVALDFSGDLVEAVLMRSGERNTVCVSSQAGCPVACSFCATGRSGFKRNLTDWEILAQVLFFARLLKEKNEKIDNVVFMGMGEPFLNYDNAVSAAKIINDENGLNIGARKISISTIGIIEGIKNFAKEKEQFNLAVSIHAPNDELRSKLIPLNRKYPLKKLLTEISAYIKAANRKVMIEYVLLGGINDSDRQAEELAELLAENLPKPFMVNLISYNQTGYYRPSAPDRAKKFKEILENRAIPVIERYRFGRDIKAACGQLARKDNIK